MPDNTQKNQTTTAASTSGQTTGDDGIIVDKNKSASQYMKEAAAKYIIPTLVREKFPDLIKLIYETESMNQEEREYWLQIMPIMSEDQIVKFRDILVNEKEQLANLDKEYEKEMAKINAKKPEIKEEDYKGKMQQIAQAEKSSEESEKTAEEELLKKLQE